MFVASCVALHDSIRDSNLLNLAYTGDTSSPSTVRGHFQQFGQCGNQAKYFVSNIPEVYITVDVRRATVNQWSSLSVIFLAAPSISRMCIPLQFYHRSREISRCIFKTFEPHCPVTFDLRACSSLTLIKACAHFFLLGGSRRCESARVDYHPPAGGAAKRNSRNLHSAGGVTLSQISRSGSRRRRGGPPPFS